MRAAAKGVATRDTFGRPSAEINKIQGNTCRCADSLSDSDALRGPQENPLTLSLRRRIPCNQPEANWPPFADIVAPVINPASSLARNATHFAISSALPRRPTGICAMTRLAEGLSADRNEVLKAVEDPPRRATSAVAASISRSRPTYGAGRIDVLVLGGFFSHVERVWEEPRCRAFLSSLARMGRLTARSSRHRAFRPGRVHPQRRRDRAGHWHRA